MKKLVLALAVAFGASMVACSNSNKEAEGAAEGQEMVVEEQEVVTETPADSAKQEAAAPADSATAAQTAAPADSAAAQK